MKFYELVCVEHDADFQQGKCDIYEAFDTLREATRRAKEFASKHPEWDVVLVRMVEFRELHYF